MKYIIYCDESSSSGPKYSDFFGGCIVASQAWNVATEALNKKKRELNLKGEIKWTKVTAQHLDRYIQVMDLFFDFVRDEKIRVRIKMRFVKDNFTEGVHFVIDPSVLGKSFLHPQLYHRHKEQPPDLL